MQQRRRLAFIERLCSDIPAYPVTLTVARLAGQIDGEQEAKNIKVPFEDLLIGCTALHLSYSVATNNSRDFERIPGLSVVRI